MEVILDTSNIEVLNVMNHIGILLCLVGYTLAVRTLYNVLWAFLMVFFSISFLAYITKNFEFNQYPYFLPLLIAAILIATPLYLVGLIKENRYMKKNPL